MADYRTEQMQRREELGLTLASLQREQKLRSVNLYSGTPNQDTYY